MSYYRREGTPRSSLIEPTFGPESRTAHNRQNGELQCMYICAHKDPTVFFNTADRSSGAVFITATGFLGQKTTQLQ